MEYSLKSLFSDDTAPLITTSSDNYDNVQLSMNIILMLAYSFYLSF